MIHQADFNKDLLTKHHTLPHIHSFISLTDAVYSVFSGLSLHKPMGTIILKWHKIS